MKARRLKKNKMAILKSADVLKMSEKERTTKISELKVELIKAKVSGKKVSKLSLREIKKAIAKLKTFNSMDRIKAEMEKAEKPAKEKTPSKIKEAKK